jgi:O-antigen ligase
VNQHYLAAVLRGRVIPLAAKTAGTAGVLAVSAFAGATAAGETQTRLGERPALLLMGAVGAAGVLAIFAMARHQVLLAWPALTGLLFPFVQFPRHNPIVTFDRVWVFGLIAVIAAVGAQPRPNRARLQFTHILVGFAVAWGLRALVSPNNTSGIVAWIDTLVLPYLLFTATRLFAGSEPGRRRLAAALMVGGVVLAGIGIAETIFGFELASRTGGALRVETELSTVRLSGPYTVPEPYALSLLMTLAATLYWMQLRGPGRLFIGLSAAAVELSAIGLTLFRAAWIGAGLVLFMAIGMRRGRWPRAVYVGAVMAAILFSAVSEVRQHGGLSERINNTDNIYGRLATYEQGFGMFASHPLVGVGVDQYHAVAADLQPRVVHGVESVSFPHSSFILVLAEQGLIGTVPLLLLAFATWRLVRAARRARSPDAVLLWPAAGGAALAYLVMSATLTMITYGASNAFFAMILGLVAGMLDGDASTDTGSVEA